MNTLIDPADLITAHDVAAIVGVTRIATVHEYVSRDPSMPRPVYTHPRLTLWNRPDIEDWAADRHARFNDAAIG